MTCIIFKHLAAHLTHGSYVMHKDSRDREEYNIDLNFHESWGACGVLFRMEQLNRNEQIKSIRIAYIVVTKVSPKDNTKA